MYIRFCSPFVYLIYKISQGTHINIKFCMSAILFESRFTCIILYFNLFNSMNNNLNTIWIDIENTLVESWDINLPINIEKIDNIIKKFSPCNIGIFSFAIWNDENKREFNEKFKNDFQTRLNCIIDDNMIPTKMKLFNDIRNANIPEISLIPQSNFTFMDFCDFWNKERAFVDWIRLTNKTGTHILIDDFVQNATLTFNDCNIILINV